MACELTRGLNRPTDHPPYVRPEGWGARKRGNAFCIYRYPKRPAIYPNRMHRNGLAFEFEIFIPRFFIPFYWNERSKSFSFYPRISCHAHWYNYEGHPWGWAFLIALVLFSIRLEWNGKDKPGMAEEWAKLQKVK